MEITMKISTVKGTNDWLPREAQLRDYLQNSILTTYRSHGFRHIMTPAIEDAENLDKSDGGENLNLIFKILKRGDKLDDALSKVNSGASVNELSDLGLRYDLTLPLTRYYANNKDKLILPAKCIQIDKVYRAERPQRGRMREFIQCDIDILGSSSYCAEVELIDTTAQALLNIGMSEFRIHINDRSLLRSLLLALGFESDQLDSVSISFDKLDKIGSEGVAAELTEKGFSSGAISNLSELLKEAPVSLERIGSICTGTAAETVSRLKNIMTAVDKLSNGRYDVIFDMSLVRGQGYYTGTVFEIESMKYKGSVGGGGRYDNLIGKFLGESVPAVGFSIGFERIFDILLESGYHIPEQKKVLALIYTEENFIEASDYADTLRNDYDVAMFERPKKLGKLLDRLQEQDYQGFTVYGEDGGIKLFS